MKPCDKRWRNDLLDFVLGYPATPELTAHLASCPICSAAFQEWRARVGQIDEGVQRMIAARHSPHTIPRMMAHVRAARPTPWLRGREWRIAAFCALALTIAAVTYEWEAREHRQEAMQELSAASAIGNWRSPTDSLLRSPADQWLNTPPQLGKYFYQLNSRVPEKENKNP